MAAKDLARQDPPASTTFATLWPAAGPAAAPRPGPAQGRWTRAAAALLGPRRGGLALASCALLVVGSLVLTLQPWAPAASPAGPQVVVRDGWEMLPGGFVPVAGAERWLSPGAGRGVTDGWIVRAELPAERLAGLGLPFDPAGAAERIPAELLVHANGEVLAVRVLF